MLVSILIATLCQPTAIGALAWLPITLACVWFARDRRQLFRFSLADVIVGIAACAIGLTLWLTTLGDSWQHRGSWASFATASNARQLWEAWDWIYLILAPLGIACAAHAMIGLSKSSRPILFATLLYAIIAIVATAAFWSVSRLDIVPIWHRRFFVAVLPILASVVGCSVAVVHQLIRRRHQGTFVTSAIAVALLAILVLHQDKLTKLSTHPVALVSRGEDWRAATKWVRANTSPEDRIYLDPALIESNVRIDAGLSYQIFPIVVEMQNQRMPEVPTTAQSPAMTQYLAFALHGPYSVNRRWSGPGDLYPEKWPIKNVDDRRVFLIARRSADQFDQLKSSGARVMSFGKLTVVSKSFDQ